MNYNYIVLFLLVLLVSTLIAGLLKKKRRRLTPEQYERYVEAEKEYRKQHPFTGSEDDDEARFVRGKAAEKYAKDQMKATDKT